MGMLLYPYAISITLTSRIALAVAYGIRNFLLIPSSVKMGGILTDAGFITDYQFCVCLLLILLLSHFDVASDEHGGVVCDPCDTPVL